MYCSDAASPAFAATRLLSDRHVNAYNALILLIQYRVQRDRRFPRLTVADDQFALTAADGEHRVDDEQPRLEGLVDGLSVDDAGRGLLDGAVAVRPDLARSVDRIAKRVHDAPQKALSDGNACGLPRAPDPAAGDDLAAAAEDDDPAVSGGKILYHSFDPAGKQDDLPVSRVFQP